ncbi:MAG: response regulator [Phycisphaerae bacterium]|nr:response regulator [Phycisphaerae bacterium]
MNMDAQSKLILLVDDDPDVLLLVGARLGAVGYRVVPAADGEAALQKFAAVRPDLVVLDLGLPKKDGLEVCRTLKSDAATRDIPIVILSAKSQTTHRQAVLDCGADVYLVKPFDPQVLLGAIRDLLQGAAVT